jgi:signal transduction histidine kinase
MKWPGRSFFLADDPKSRQRLTVVIWALVIGIGLVDYAIDVGDEISLRLFYFIPVSLAVIARGWRFAVLVAAACVVVMISGDLAAGAKYANWFIPCWNGFITFGTYLIIIWLLSGLLNLHRELEERVRQRTAALADEIAERKRLELEIVATAQKERWSIGHELHDGPCQHFTGTALVTRVLAEELAEKHEPTAERAARIVRLIEEGIGQLRRLARGLLLVSVEEGGLCSALQELAAASSEQYRIRCECNCNGEPALQDAVTASHFYHIAQEAIRNAARHSKPDFIMMTLRADSAAQTLIVSDNGIGIGNNGGPSEGMGLRIMAHRAAMIGASLSVAPGAPRGTTVTCRLPLQPSKP